MVLKSYFLISWIIDKEELTKDICRKYLESYNEDENYHMINFLNSIISGKSTFDGMFVWSTIGNYSVLYEEDLIPLFKKLYDANAINPRDNIIIINQTKSGDMHITEFSLSGKVIEVRENYDTKLKWNW